MAGDLEEHGRMQMEVGQMQLRCHYLCFPSAYSKSIFFHSASNKRHLPNEADPAARGCLLESIGTVQPEIDLFMAACWERRPPNEVPALICNWPYVGRAGTFILIAVLCLMRIG